MWTNAVGGARELHRIGFQTMPGEPIIDVSQPTGLGGPDSEEGVPLDKVPGRLMSFLFHFAEARLWSYAWLQFAYPEAFAGLLSPNRASEAWEDARELWVAATDAEASAHTLPSVRTLRQEVYWLSWTLVQFVFRWLAQVDFKPCHGILSFLLMLFRRIGDTKCIEESHKIGRQLERKGQDRKKLEPDVFYARLQREKTPLQQRGIPRI